MTAFQSVSADPPTVLVSLGTGTVAAEAIADGGRFWVNVLGPVHVALARDAAARGAPRFLSSAVVDGALAQLDCEVVDAIEVADHRSSSAACSLRAPPGAARRSSTTAAPTTRWGEWAGQGSNLRPWD